MAIIKGIISCVGKDHFRSIFSAGIYGECAMMYNRTDKAYL
jgi:hypothetical protein